MSFTSLKSSLTFSTSEKYFKCQNDHHNLVLILYLWDIQSWGSHHLSAMSCCPNGPWSWQAACTPSQTWGQESTCTMLSMILTNMSSLSPPAAGTLCRVPEPSILMTHNCAHKPGIACRTEMTEIWNTVAVKVWSRISIYL